MLLLRSFDIRKLTNSKENHVRVDITCFRGDLPVSLISMFAHSVFTVPGITFEVSGDNMRHLFAKIDGPQDSPYEALNQKL